MFSQTIYMEQVSTKNHLTLAKTNRVSQYTLSIQKLCYLNTNIKARVKNTPSLFSSCLRIMNQ